MPTRRADIDYEVLLVGVRVLQLVINLCEVVSIDDALGAYWVSAQVDLRSLTLPGLRSDLRKVLVISSL